MVLVKTSPSQSRIISDQTEVPERFYEKNKDIYNLVNNVLKEKLIARNNDLWLIFLCWLKQGKLKQVNLNGKRGLFLNKEDLLDLELPSTITRERRTIQNKELRLLPTDEKVINQRKINFKNCKRIYRWITNKNTT